MAEELLYWYDGQQRRYLEQIVRAFSVFSYKTGWRNGEPPMLKKVLCKPAARDRMVSQIVRNGSENTMLVCPLITVDQTGLTPRRGDLQNPTHVDTVMVTERAKDPVTGQYTGEIGNRYSVRRMMPLPFEMTIQVDLWTSNQNQKHQLAEQILMVAFPDIQMQNSDNPLDWSARTMMTFEDLTWTSRTVPIGSESEIDIMSMTFKLPMWISPPAEVTQQKIISQIVANVREAEEKIDGTYDGPLMSRQIVTPGNHLINVDGKTGQIVLLGEKGSERDDNGNVYDWDSLFRQYGSDIRLMTSEIRLKRNDDIESEDEIVGLIHPTNQPNVLEWQIDPDTLPSNTLQPVRGLIDPRMTHPGSGLVPQNGHRYLLLEDLSPSQAWGNITARENDIIRYNNGVWEVDFVALANPTEQYLVNLYSNTQLRWTGHQWQLAIGGTYGPGYWRLLL